MYDLIKFYLNCSKHIHFQVNHFDWLGLDTSILRTWKQAFLTRLGEVQQEKMMYNETYINSITKQDVIVSEIENTISRTFQHLQLFKPNLTGRDRLKRRLEVLKMIKGEVLKSKAQLARNHSSILAMFHSNILNLRSLLTLINFLLYDLV